MIDRFLEIFIPLIIIVNPSSTLALFSIITSRYTKKERIKTAKNAAFYAALLLIIFALAGSSILNFLGLQIYSLRIAGGILLAFVGLDMVRRGEQFGETPPDKKEKPDYALVPLAMPSLSGPGAITVIIVSMKNLQSYQDLSWYVAITFAIIAILLTMVITFFIFLSSNVVSRILGKKGMDALTRVMGLLTVGIAVQFALTGLAGWLLDIGAV
jgi:multiple antibiotic resistance protein